jgi:cell division protein ZapE
MLAQARLICLDEFHVSDITDAMLLYGLLDEMYRQGAVFIMTSNVMPDDLYQNGLQRSRFLPAIELIKQRSHVLQFDGDKDYRLQKHLTNRNYYCPLRVDTDCQLEERFRKLAKGEITKETKLTINNRPVYARARAENIVWFDFQDICGGPRAAMDYIDIAQRYEFVIISNVFKLSDAHDDIARRFINLVDEFYDRGTGLIISADGWPGELYSGRRFAFEFERTISRLQEIRCRNLQPLDDSWVDAKIDGAGKSAG